MTKTVAVLGGSFNPPHEGHFGMGLHLHKALNVDEVWMMFSVNRLKDPASYASLEHRMEMGRIMARHYPQIPFVMTDVEEKTGTHQTYFVLKKLQELYPDHRFIWVMGADNLLGFEKWVRGDDIFREFPVAIVERAGYTAQALASETLKRHASIKLEDTGKITRGSGAGWVFLPGDESLDMSSSALLKRLRAGEVKFEGHFQEIVDYIREKGLYGIGSSKKIEPRPSAP